MANKDAAFGLKPSRMMGGAPYSGGQSRYRIATSVSAIFQGDLVSSDCWCVDELLPHRLSSNGVFMMEFNTPIPPQVSRCSKIITLAQ